MSFRQFLLTLRARWITVALTLLFAVLMAVTLSLLLPPRFAATTTLVLDFKGVDPVLGIMLPAQLMPGYMATQVDIIQSHKVAVDVVKILKLTDSPAVRQQWLDDTKGRGTIEDWLAGLLLKNLDVKPSPESSVLDIVWKGADPQFAALVSNAFAEQYVKTNLQLQVDPARQSAVFFDEQLAALRENLEKAQKRLNDYQREKGYSSADERLDVETSRLAELSTQYTIAQATAADASSRQQQLRDFLDRGANPETLPDVLANPLINSLKTQVLQSEARLEQISSQLGANHPEVQKLKADITSQRQKLKAEIVTVTVGITNNLRIASQRESTLRQAMADQKARLMRLNQGRDEMAVLAKELESAQRAYDTAAQRFSQTNLESKSGQTNIAILTRAVPPIEPSFPNLILNLAIAIGLGIILGAGLAFLREMADRRIRSVVDLVEIEGVPVIGHLYRARRRWAWPQLRRKALRDAAGAVS